MNTVYIKPSFDHPDRADGGIRRVVDAQRKYLPQFGWQVVAEESKADLIALHGTEISGRTDVPIVSHNHGLHWDRYDWGDWGDQVNQAVVNSMRCAVAHTAPSEWVSTSLRRGMMVYPQVVYHGVDGNDFSPPDMPGNYVLWNKARTDPVSDPADLNKTAPLLTSRLFITTFGDPAPNVQIIGAIPYDKMKELVRNAGVYLATTRETFGIGMLEALACGVPVVAWNWGGAAEIILDDETGYLVEPGNYPALASAIERAFVNRARLSVNARLDALDRWQWQDKIKQYADLYTETLKWWKALTPKVSVIVTCHNLAKYLPDTLNSLKAQTMKDWEAIIVDDFSTDDSQAVAEGFVQKDSRFRYFKTRFNMGLVGARNMGVHRSTGKYICMLDADDMLETNALAILSEELDKDSKIHIAYGHLDTVDEAGENRGRSQGWPFDQFNWHAQMAHYNQLPYNAMMRRLVFEQCGGYRSRLWRAEDAEFWCRATSYGFVAKKVTDASLLIYRNRAQSKSKGEPGDGPWTQSFGWNTGLAVGDVPFRLALDGSKTTNEIVPFGAQGQPYNRTFWQVKDHAYPLVSVVIPVGPDHERLLIDALDSLVAQNFIYWEAIVVNDTGREWTDGYGSPVWGAPFARVVKTGGTKGAGAARNLGAKIARGQTLLFLDADDYLMPNALMRMWKAFQQTGMESIIYTDWYRDDSEKPGQSELKLYESEDFKCADVLGKMRHAVTALIPIDAFEKINGFDESMMGWEDWDLYIALQTTGICSYRLPEPLFAYRFRAGKRREDAFGNQTELLKKIHDKWIDYYEGTKTMAGCAKCPGGIINLPVSFNMYNTSNSAQGEKPSADMVLLEYQGPHAGPVTIRGGSTGAAYRFGNSGVHKQKYVWAADVKEFLERNYDGKPIFVEVPVMEIKA